MHSIPDYHTDLSRYECHSEPGQHSVNGVRFDLLSPEQLVRTIDSFVKSGESHVVNFLAVDPTVRAGDDVAYRQRLNQSDLNIADGQPITWAVRLGGQRTARIAGTQAFELLCETGLRSDRTHFLYGGTPQVSEQLQRRLRERYTGINIAGIEVPPMGMPSDTELSASATKVRDSGADLLWIGIGTPNQHYVGGKLRELGAAPVILCVGAAFDFMASTKKRAPVWMQRTGLEWFYRLLREPRRLGPRYLAQNPRFAAAVAREHLIPSRR